MTNLRVGRGAVESVWGNDGTHIPTGALRFGELLALGETPSRREDPAVGRSVPVADVHDELRERITRGAICPKWFPPGGDEPPNEGEEVDLSLRPVLVVGMPGGAPC